MVGQPLVIGDHDERLLLWNVVAASHLDVEAEHVATQVDHGDTKADVVGVVGSEQSDDQHHEATEGGNDGNEKSVVEKVKKVGLQAGFMHNLGQA